MMIDNFQTDLAWGKQGEEIVLNVLSALRSDLTFVDVSNDYRYYHNGDIAAIDKKTDKIYFIEVKNDSRIADTGNILCEDEVYYKRHDYSARGNMYNNTDIYAIVSKKEKKIYFIDFKILQKNYTLGEFRKMDYPQQYSYVFLLPLGTIKKLGGLLAVVNYDEIAVAA